MLPPVESHATCCVAGRCPVGPRSVSVSQQVSACHAFSSSVGVLASCQKYGVSVRIACGVKGARTLCVVHRIVRVCF